MDAKETAVVVAETEKEETVAGTSLLFSTDVVGSSSSAQQQQQQHLDQKIKMNAYFVATFLYFSSVHPVSTAAQSTTITEASQSRGQK